MWWNNRYLFRRKISIAGKQEIPAGHPIYVELDDILLENNKIRSDFLDIEIVYEPEGQDPVVLERHVEVVQGHIEERFVSFDLAAHYKPEFELDALINYLVPMQDYWLYYGNPLLINSPRLHLVDAEATQPDPELIYPNPNFVQGGYTPDDWPISTSHSDGRISYTRPGQHWIRGESNVPMARATLSFDGDRVRVISKRGPNFGNVDIQVNFEPWVTVSQYAATTESGVTIFQQHALSNELNEIRVRVPSNGGAVNIDRIEYSRNSNASYEHEEVNHDIVWSVLSGGV